MAAFDPNSPHAGTGTATGTTAGTTSSVSSKSIPELLTDLVRDLGELFRKEGRLVRAEISEAGKRLASGIEMMGAGAVLLLVALFVLVQALVIALAELVGPGWASLIVGGLLAVIGVVLIMRGRKDLSASSLMPERAIEQTSRDVRLAKEQI